MCVRAAVLAICRVAAFRLNAAYVLVRLDLRISLGGEPDRGGILAKEQCRRFKVSLVRIEILCRVKG